MDNIKNLNIENKCTCNNAQCSKCLLVNCKDDTCKFHPLEKKKEFRLKYSVGRTGNLKN